MVVRLSGKERSVRKYFIAGKTDEGVDIKEGMIGLQYFNMAGATDGEVVIVEERTFGLYVAIEEGAMGSQYF
ncbi:hypothetical protein O988_02501 [Pseudogymnoascus sp. VKM F-3808]|nr:hypothetical protein O988_02501 [Pseudogymnoascus sp. VKM F-3808]